MRILIYLFITILVVTNSMAQNVGIGTTMPQEKLDVNGNILLSGGDRIISAANGATAYSPGDNLLISAGNGAHASYATNGGNLVLQAGNSFSQGTAGYVPGNLIFRSGANANQSVQFPSLVNGGYISFEVGTASSGHSEKLRIDENGNVGIGTSTPNAKLNVAGGLISLDMNKYLTINPTDNFTFDSKPVGQYSLGWYNDSWSSSAGPAAWLSAWGGIRFFTQGANRMNIDVNGNVGINTSTPVSKLHIVHAGNYAANDFAQHGLAIWSQADGFGMKLQMGADKNNNISYIQSVLGNVLAYPLVLNPTGGNVGIGTIAPTARLSVNGNANNTTGAWGVFSDARLKTITNDFTDGLNIINQLHPVKFRYNADAPFKTDTEQIGIVAQELEKLAPYMVTKNKYEKFSDLREVNNQAYTFLLINAVKTQQTEIEALKEEIKKIKAQLGVTIQSATQ
jgi:hypothetical protein